MKKRVVFIIAILFLLVGCGAEFNTPTKEVEMFLNKYQKNDSEVVNQFDTSLLDEGNLCDEQKEKYKEIMLGQYKDLTYEIKEEKIDGNKAKVEVEIEVYDYTTALNNAYMHLEENQDQFYVDDVLDVVKFVDYKLDQLFNYKNRINYTIVFNLERENTESEWVLKDLSEADLKKIHGIYSN